MRRQTSRRRWLHQAKSSGRVTMSIRRRDILACSLSTAATLVCGEVASAQSKPAAGKGPPPVVAPPGIKVFSKMPQSANDVASAHLLARDQPVEFLPKDEPLELNSFVVKFSKRDTDFRN